jgi:hypothetical protein
MVEKREMSNNMVFLNNSTDAVTTYFFLSISGTSVLAAFSTIT